jgi:arabinose-5-phosphate isomerase
VAATPWKVRPPGRGAVYRVDVYFVGGLSEREAYNPRAMQSPAAIPTSPADDNQLLAYGRRALEIEAQAVAGLAPRLDARFAAACRICLACEGRVVATGIGKSGHVARKIGATFASTGTPAFFLHPAEAGHGDLGMITRADAVVAVSNSGETPELVLLLPHLKRLGVPLIVLVGKVESTLGRAASVAVDVSVPEEACPLNLAPTASTTATLAMGDALAVAVLEARGFTKQDFALSHPGGTLGRQLLLHVEDVMRTGAALPRISADDQLGAGLIEMSRKGLGMTVVIDPDDHILGVFTDGDLRRAFDKQIDVHKTAMREVMTSNCKTIGPRALAAEAVHIMEMHRITALPVVDSQGRLIGALNVHDLFRAGVV